ncbi:MAG: tetratricopeptide repeat protein, partial [Candidatus Eremiobacterota bacterium]
ILGQLERRSEALACHGKAIQLNPHHPLLWANQGDSQEALGQLEDALKSYLQAIRLAPKETRLLELKARVLRKLGRTGEAEAVERNEKTWLVYVADKAGEAVVEIKSACLTGRLDGPQAARAYMEMLTDRGHRVTDQGVVDGLYQVVFSELVATP